MFGRNKKDYVWVAHATQGRYYGSLVGVKVWHFLITPDSKPMFSLKYYENVEKGFVKPYKGRYETYTRLVESLVTGNTYLVVYVSETPFALWRRVRGEMGDKDIEEDEVISSKRIRKSQLRDYLIQLSK